MKDCPCGSKKLTVDCCDRFINNTLTAPTAESLMRSRYTAYTQSNIDYLQETSHTGNFDEHTKQWASYVEWLGLEVLKVVDGNENDNTGEVSYIARYRENHQQRSIVEHALFQKVNGKWRYTGPKAKIPLQGKSAPGRNDPCSCGSGKKFKKCCAKNK